MIKYTSVLALFLLAMVSCNKELKNNPVEQEQPNYEVFGDSISTTKVLTGSEMEAFYKELKKGDSVSVAFKSTIKEVCQKKGCWMRVALSDSLSSFVKFQDAGKTEQEINQITEPKVTYAFIADGVSILN